MKFIKFSLKSDIGKKMLSLSFLLFFMFLGVHSVGAQNYVSPKKAEAQIYTANKEMYKQLGAVSYKEEMLNIYSENSLRIRAYNILAMKLQKSVSTLDAINETMTEVEAYLASASAEGNGPIAIEFEKESFSDLRAHLTQMLTK